MMNPTVRVDERSCLKTAELLKQLHLRKSFYERPFLRISAPDEIRLRGYFYSVAICHQTYQLQNKKLNLFGWDYLEYVFTILMANENSLLSPGSLSKMPVDDLQAKLALLFSPDGLIQNSTLDRLEERSKMLIELDKFLETSFQSSLLNFVETTGSKLLNAGNGFYESLPLIQAFADPLRKKTTFLLKLLEEAGMLSIRDPENFIPIMDYHMQRVLLRIGCVRTEDHELHHKLVSRTPIKHDTEIRKACIEAFRIISGVSGHVVTKMNDFFWSLGRSCCNESPLCQAGQCEKDPCTFFEIVELEEHKECYFKSECKGYTDRNFRDLWQPIIETHFY